MATRRATAAQDAPPAPEKVITEIRDARTSATLATVESYYGPAVVVIKRVGWRVLEDAAAAGLRDGLKVVRDVGGAQALQDFQELAAANRKDGDTRSDVEIAREVEAAAKKRDPLASYDKFELVMRGVVAIDDAEKTREQVEELEPEVMDAIATAIVRLARPGLFETEAGRKND